MRNLFFIFVLFTSLTNAQLVSGFNDLPIRVNNSGSYSFYVGGHFHGSSTNLSGYPASSLLANLDELNSDTNSFIISTGDLFLDIKNNIPNYKKSLFSKLKIPLFNAVGNHDVSGDIYNSNFGATWHYFIIGTELYIILDAEINDGSIKGEQLKFFKKTIEFNCNKQSNISNVFIFTHRPIWTESDEKFESIFVDNTQSNFSNNFNADVLPILATCSTKQNIFWFSGSLGANAPVSFFYHKNKNSITFIQSAIRDLPRDGIIKVKINNSQVSFETISLSGLAMPKLESCDLNMWKNMPKSQPFNYRLIPLYLKQMVFHRYFWYGIIGGIILFFISRKLLRKLKFSKVA